MTTFSLRAARDGGDEDTALLPPLELKRPILAPGLRSAGAPRRPC